ncbi:hypothetical protein ABAC460_07320 [Asticcacaulis sp. AC460]|uniref:hypothetical protein n=1 Tax=Asticcacaulis sp. AC460 TaxID=1282360 RepID=UPI0003C3FA51|nr:hypothetical protein [Asticcacaulis sp. AC460]ESQ91095.1 hypothetical protein ABAC460_07320 [Asticcacaulis sp. AC460]
MQNPDDITPATPPPADCPRQYQADYIGNSSVGGRRLAILFAVILGVAALAAGGWALLQAMTS